MTPIREDNTSETEELDNRSCRRTKLAKTTVLFWKMQNIRKTLLNDRELCLLDWMMDKITKRDFK